MSRSGPLLVTKYFLFRSNFVGIRDKNVEGISEYKRSDITNLYTYDYVKKSWITFISRISRVENFKVTNKKDHETKFCFSIKLFNGDEYHLDFKLEQEAQIVYKALIDHLN